SVTVANDELSIGVNANYTATFVGGDMYGGTMLNFKMMADFRTNGWFGITLNQSEYPGLVWDGNLDANGYLFVFKEDIIELQRYVNGQITTFGPGYDPIIVEPNNGVLDEQWADIQMGAIDVDGGAAVKVILKVNGVTIYDV